MVSLHAALAALALSGVGQTVMLDFYADWCGPCKAMHPTVQALAAAGYPVEQVNIDQNRKLAAKYGIQSIPCFVMLVDGKEVDRVVGGTTFSRLERMCKAGALPNRTGTTPAMFARNTPAAVRPAALTSPAMAAPFEGWGQTQSSTNPQAALPAGTVDVAVETNLLAASVRLRVEDPDGHSCGSGTIIDARSGEALILTCGHIFRDSKGKGRIDVDLFGPGGSQRVEGRLISFDSEVRDVGLVAIRTPGPVAAARVAPPGYRLAAGMPVVSVGCNNGDAPTARHSQINSLDKFTGPPNIQVAGQPVEGRSGGGLFSAEGYVLGVCNAADPSDKEGLFAALGSIYAELDRAQLTFLYKSAGENPSTLSEATVPSALAAAASPTMPAGIAHPAGPASMATIPSMPASLPEMPQMPSASSASGLPGFAAAGLPAHEQAALEEIRRSRKGGAEVVIIVRPRDNAESKSEVFVLDHASAEFRKQLVDVTRAPDRVYQETSMELPKPRKKLLEWSAGDQ
jgi:thiol-disulfide isomerase/thioredoxin